MRKFMSLMAALLVLLSLACPALAVPASNKDVFYESVGAKDAPKIIDAQLGDDDVTGCIVVTSLKQAEDESTPIEQEDFDLLLNTYKALNDKTMASPASKGYVIRELMDVSFTTACRNDSTHNHEEELAKTGTKIDLTFKTNIPNNAKVEIHYYLYDEVAQKGKWVKATDVKNEGNGKISGTFEDICPVAICVKKGTDTQSPQTGDRAFPTVWIAVMAVSLVVLIALVILRKKFRK